MLYPEGFVGGYGPEAFMAWADSLDSFIAQNQVSSLESLSLAVSLLRGESRAWWRVEEEARWSDEEPIYTWDELKIIMCSKYVPGFQWEEEQSDSLPEDSLPMIAAEQEGETQELCLHVPNQTKQEQKVLGESSTTPELAHALIDQGESFRSLYCGLLTWFTLDFQPSLVEYLRVVKGLQQYVFEPGGSLSVSRRSNNNLVQKTVSYKLDWQGSFTPGEQDLRSNLFEGREDGVILSSSSKQRGGTRDNTSLIRSTTDQNKLRRAKQKLVVIKEKPILVSEYGDQCTRPPDLMQQKNQVKMCAGQGALRDIRSILLLQHKGLLQTLKQPARFMHDIGESVLLSDQVEGRIHAEISMYEASVSYNRRVAVKIKLINVQQQPDFEQDSKRLMRNRKGLQCWVFDPGDDHGSIILQDLDLRTNPFEGREYGAILSRLKLKGWDPWYGIAKSLIKAWLNGKFQGLTGMIYEVLDREKRRTLGTALKQLEQSTETNRSWIRRQYKLVLNIEINLQTHLGVENILVREKQVGTASTIRWAC